MILPQAKILVPLGFMLLWGCASTTVESPSEALEPVGEPEERPLPLAEESGELVEPTPQYQKLKDQLESLGYQGVGLQYENPPVLEFLYSVFSDPRTAGLPLKRVYTGLQMAYDRQHHSVTIGGTRDVESVIRYLQENATAP